jgi:hypothetical protein
MNYRDRYDRTYIYTLICMHTNYHTSRRGQNQPCFFECTHFKGFPSNGSNVPICGRR